MKEKGKRKRDRKEQRGDATYIENVRAKWSWCAFKLICNASLIFKSHLELASSIISKERHGGV